ncbi:MAG: DUF4159 domain-containing protein [Parvularculaceae bacterium]
MPAIGSLSFAAPHLLIALAALPAIWLLMRLTPPPPRREAFPPFAILASLADARRAPAKTPWLLLLLRALVAALAIVGLAGPILGAPAESGLGRPLLLVVDDSWAAAADWRLRRNALAAAAETARAEVLSTRILTTAPRAAGDDGALSELLTPSELEATAGALDPTPLAPDYAAAAEVLRAASLDDGPYDVRWLRDGLRHEGADDFADLLRAEGALTAFDNPRGVLTIGDADAASGARTFRVRRIGGDGPWRARLVARARDGRELARSEAAAENNADALDIELDLPLALRNDVGLARLEGVASAGAVRLIDGRRRRALVGLAADAGAEGLLSGAYYIRTALDPYAAFIDGGVDELARSAANVIVLDDVGRLRGPDAAALGEWVDKGGVLIRFAGETLADAANDFGPRGRAGAPRAATDGADTPLLPTPLRGGGRAFGGALTWETPQRLGAFSANGPFAGMATPGDVVVRRQVLAQPGGETSARTWASLADGTPLVTGAARGAGAVALFHVTATSDWSDLPLSSAFPEMLRRLSFLATTSARVDPNEGDAATRHAPLRALDGFGALRAPGPSVAAASLEALDAGPAVGRPPGLYGPAGAPFAVNAFADVDALERAPALAESAPYAGAPPRRLARPLLLAAALLLLIDAVGTLIATGRLRLPRSGGMRAATAAAAGAMTFIVTTPDLAWAADVEAQTTPLDPPVTAFARAAALETRLAYVRTGDPGVDRISKLGLDALSRELTRRTALEPGEPVGVDVETDELSVVPLIYWPMAAGGPDPSAEGLARIEEFMRNGGLVLFDTRDGERAFAGVETPEAAALAAILRRLDAPPLRPLPQDHVLKRSFYLLADLPGRAPGYGAGGAIWVQAGGDANDAVTPLIIGGRDWAGAWAADAFGRPVLPNPAGGPRAREYALRAGVNIVMVALTGNYKSDQVHTPILLRRLGQ